MLPTPSLFPWRRFWSRLGKPFALDGRGYLHDPEEEYGRLLNPELATLPSLLERPCVVLLGAPGMGKSSELEFLKGTRSHPEGGHRLFVDLRSCGSESSFEERLVKSEIWRDWAKGQSTLELVVDSLDECSLRVQTIALLLSEHLASCDPTRLRLRIACRSAEWPELLSEALTKLYAPANLDVEKYQLAPLRRKDVLLAAEATLPGDPQDFLREVDEREMGPFAQKPVTLKFMLNLKAKGNAFPSTQAEFYRKGCLQLCTEFSKSRRSANQPGRYTDEQRFAVAARIAATQLLGAYTSIWAGPDQGNAPPTALRSSQLVGGEERAGGTRFVVTADAVKEALSTLLFSARSQEEGELGFDHQTYAEFLAGEYLVQNELPLPQIRSLLFHEEGDRVVPQLQEVCGWVVGRVPALAKDLLPRDPAVLLRSDVLAGSADSRCALVTALLGGIEAGSLNEYSLSLYEGLERLAHPGLDAQLRPYLVDRAREPAARFFAVEVASRCRVPALQGDLANLALDAAEEIDLRCRAARAVRKGGDPASCSRLLPLARLQAGPDPERRLQAEALPALWPGFLSTQQVFSLIGYGNRGILGDFGTFVGQTLLDGLSLTDLPVALAWVEHHPSRHRSLYGYTHLFEGILAKAWQHCEQPGVANALASAIAARIRNHESRFTSNGGVFLHSSDTITQDRRRRLLVAIAERLGKELASRLVWAEPHLLTGDDLPWMVDRVRNGATAGERALWSFLIWHIANQGPGPHLDPVYAAASSIPDLATELAPFISVPLNSARAAEDRKNERLRARYAKAANDSHQTRSAHRLRSVLAHPSFEAAGLWPEAAWALAQSGPSGDFLRVTSKALWQGLTSNEQGALLGLAKEYLQVASPGAPAWLNSSEYPDRDLAGFHALQLVFELDPAWLDTLPDTLWAAWTPAVAVCPYLSQETGALVERFYRRSSWRVLAAVTQRIQAPRPQGAEFRPGNALLGCWDGPMARTFLSLAHDPNLPPGVQANLLEELLARSTPGSAELALATARSNGANSRATQVGATLFLHGRGKALDDLLTLMEKSSKKGKAILLAGSLQVQRREGEAPFDAWTERQLSRLYLWSAKHFPVDEDYEPTGVHSLTPELALIRTRDTALGNLIGRGSRAAVLELDTLVRMLPYLRLLKRSRVAARNKWLAASWKPTRPDELRRLVANRQARLVTGPDQLMELVVEVLQQMERELHGETPRVTRLWSTHRKTARSEPKDEAELSDEVKTFLVRELQSRAVAAFREVEIRRSLGRKARGQRTDIQVTATIEAPNNAGYDRVQVIIEVKGCWNKDLDTAMKTQLRDRYLAENGCRHGLYLVGHYGCKQWTKTDSRRQRGMRRDLKASRAYFDTQARQLSSEGACLRAFVLDAALRV